MSFMLVIANYLTGLRHRAADEEGFSTAELLGNAALGIVALVAIWAVMQALGLDVVDWIRTQIGGGQPIPN